MNRQRRRHAARLLAKQTRAALAAEARRDAKEGRKPLPVPSDWRVLYPAALAEVSR